MGMWFRHNNNKVADLVSGNGFAVKSVTDERQQVTWKVVHYYANQFPTDVVLSEGYTTEEEAQGALEELLVEMDITAARIQPPVTPEESNDATDEMEEEGK
jgi:hypothetical protein